MDQQQNNNGNQQEEGSKTTNAAMTQSWERFSSSVRKNKDGKLDEDESLRIVQTISKLSFGQDPIMKNVLIDGGALELVVMAIEGQEGQSASEVEILTEALKAIRLCVIRNPIGRERCRAAGILKCLEDLLKPDANATLVEDVLTTVAAVCMGDDINALQGAIATNFDVVLSNAQKEYPEAGSLHKKVAYLLALFEAIKKENHIEDGSPFSDKESAITFFDSLLEAERLKADGNNAFSKYKYAKAETSYGKAIDLLAWAKLECLKDFMGVLYSNRSACRMEIKRFEEALCDAEKSLENKPGWTKGYFRKSQALVSLGRLEEAKEILGKGLIVEPGNEALVKALKRLEVK